MAHPADGSSRTTYDDVSISWPGYATIRIEHDDTIVYLDPGRVDYGVLTNSRPQDADYVLVSHTHHYDPAAIHRVSTPETVVYVLEDVVELNNLSNRSKSDLVPPLDLEETTEVFAYEDTFAVDHIGVETVPSYNLPSPQGLNITPEGDGLQPPGTCVGFILDIDGTRFFWPSDSDVVPEHDGLDVDVFFPPLSQIVTMNRHEAADLAEALQPELVIPVHYCWEEKTPDGPFFLNGDPTAFKADVEARGLRCQVLQ